MSDPRNPSEPPSFGAVRPSGERSAMPRIAQARRPAPDAGFEREPDFHDSGDYYPDARPVRAGYDRMPEPPRRSRIITGFVWFAVVLLAVVTFSLTFLAFAPPSDLVREQIIAEVRAKTGRDLTISGGTRFTILPSLGMSLTDVALSSPPAMPGPPLITAQRLDVQVSVLPLLLREVKIDRLVLTKPVIEMTVDRNGRRSWDFAEAEDLRRTDIVRVAQAGLRPEGMRRLPSELKDFAKNSAGPATASRSSNINGVSLADVRITDGTLRYRDHRSGTRYDVQQIDATLSPSGSSGALGVTGQMTMAGNRFTVEGSIASLRDVIDQRPTKVAMKVNGQPLQMRYDGLVTPGSTTEFDGRIDVKAPSFAALATLLQLPIDPTAVPGDLAISGDVKTQVGSIALSTATVALAGTQASGSFAIETAGGKPQVKANLRIASLDLDGLSEMDLKRRAPPAQDPVAPPSGAPAAQSIDDLLRRTEGAPPRAAGPAVRGFTRRSGEDWSSETINLGALSLFDLDGRFEVAKLIWHRAKIANTQAVVSVKNGVLKINVGDAEIYGGHAKAVISIDARDPLFTVGANISAEGVAMRSLLGETADIETLEGRGRLTITVSSRGGSEREIVGGLNGKTELHMADGAIIGWSASDMIAGLGQGRIPSLDRNPSARTPFSVLSATFQIANGVARTQDLKLESPAIRSTGTGLINLVDRNVDLTVRPKANGATGIAAIELPVRIAGPWDKPSVIPDVNAALKSPQAQEAAKQVGRKLREGDVDGALRGVIGEGPGSEQKIGKAKQFLNQFLKQ
jgi:AsmA protein